MAWRPVARACLVGVGWWRWTARVADSGRAGALIMNSPELSDVLAVACTLWVPVAC